MNIWNTINYRSIKLHFDATKCYLSLVRFNITVSLGNDVIRKILET